VPHQAISIEHYCEIIITMSDPTTSNKDPTEGSNELPLYTFTKEAYEKIQSYQTRLDFKTLTGSERATLSNQLKSCLDN
jgi:hypothetical protein